MIVQLPLQAADFFLFLITEYELKYMLWMSVKGCQTLSLQVFTYNIYGSRTFKK